MRGLLRAYESLLHRYPTLSQSVQTGILVGAGDVISQTLVEKKSLKNLNYVRTLQFFSLGALYLGPVLTLWYRILDKRVGTGGKLYGLKKMALDQCCFAPFALGGFVLGANLLQGKSLPETKKTFKEVYPDLLVANYKLWPAVQIVNFYFMPLHYQVLFVQGFALFWNTYICFKTRPDK